MNKVLLVSLLVMVLFAWWDSENIIGVKQIDSTFMGGEPLWNIFWNQMSPANFWMWLGVFAAIGTIWYLFSKDKSEALGIFATPAILVWFGTQDLIYYIFSPDMLSNSVGCWADIITPISLISDLLAESCPTATSFIISGVLGVIIANWVYHKLQEAKW